MADGYGSVCEESGSIVEPFELSLVTDRPGGGPLSKSASMCNVRACDVVQGSIAAPATLDVSFGAPSLPPHAMTDTQRRTIVLDMLSGQRVSTLHRSHRTFQGFLLNRLSHLHDFSRGEVYSRNTEQILRSGHSS